MKTNLAVAPCSWGVENPLDENNPPWERVLDEALTAGYRGLELGPPGYMPRDPLLLKDQFQSRNLVLVGGTLYDDLVSPDNLKNLEEKTRAVCLLLSAVREKEQTSLLVLIDRVKEERNRTAGQSAKAPRLDKAGWAGLKESILSISRIAFEEYGIRPVIHPHAGGFLEFDDETERILQDIPHEKAGLCLDTGHLYYAGDDPSASILKYASRLDYLHFKDINGDVFARALKESAGFFTACNKGVMCSIGKGCLDYTKIREQLMELDYQGWITIEQERDPKNSGGSLKDIRESLDFLRNQGFDR